MDYFFASDIHGSAFYAEKMLDAFERSKAGKMILLGDILYHGPRNDLPEGYDPKKVISLLNPYREKILAVRGNCDAEVDQMVLSFPIMADYAYMVLNGVAFYITHGHKWNPENLPPMAGGTAFMYGHVHLPKAEKTGDIYILNPGSVSIPKGGYASSYAVLKDRTFSIRDFEGHTIKEITLEQTV
jgi:uncharacterized protein